MAIAALRQSTTSPSSFGDNNRMGNVLDFTLYPRTDNYPNRSSTSFFQNNQWSVISNLPVLQKEKLIELKEYEGFELSEWGEIKVSYDKDGFIFLYNFKFLCLNRQAHNDYYPDPFLFVCFELELEGTGSTKETALNDLYQLLNIYFDRTREMCKTPEDYIKRITTNIILENDWKQSFVRTYKRAQKLNVINNDYSHQIN